MAEENEKAETTRKIRQWLLAETDEEVKKYRARIRNIMWGAYAGISVAVGVAIAIWNNIGLGILLGGVSFSTLGALILALGAMPSEKTLLDMGGTYWNGNKYLVAELRRNRVLAQWGIFSIFIGYLFISAEMASRILG